MIPKRSYFVLLILLLASLGLGSMVQAGVASLPIPKKLSRMNSNQARQNSFVQINIPEGSEQNGGIASSQEQQAQNDPLSNESLPVAPGTFYKYYTGSDFMSRSPTLYEPVYYAPGAIYTSALSSGQSDYITRLELPQGARVTEVMYIFIDNHATNMDFFVVRYDPLGRTFADMVVLTSASASTLPRTLLSTGTPIFTVDNTNSTYQLQIRPKVASNEHVIIGVRVGYTIPMTFAPLVTK